MTLRPIRIWYEKMSPRERNMLIAFVWVAVIIWVSMLSSQFKALRMSITTTQAQLKKQQDSLNKKQSVANETKKYNQIFQTKIDSTALVPRVRNYAVAADIPAPTISSGATESKKDAIYTTSVVTIHFTKTPLRNLADFCYRVEADHPYLAIDELYYSAEPLNPHLLDGEMRVKSIELKPGALDVTSTPTKL